MNIFLNIIWVVFGGFMIAVEYVISSVLLMITIIGIPFGLQTIKLAAVALWPFGSKVVASPSSMGGCLNAIMDIIWWIVGGIPIALTHLFWGIIFCLTIVGLPWGFQHFKLMSLALFPFGKTIV
ncbi:MAG: YccF domain-containing protein [Paramuribaculum sp.]|nr:YccF domain-containing protein [Paramuribaculum sp.]